RACAAGSRCRPRWTGSPRIRPRFDPNLIPSCPRDAMDAAARSPSDNKVIACAYGVAAITYPLWSLITPGPIDPLGPWLGIGACMLTASIAVARWRLSRAEIADLALLLGSLVTLHFF